MKGRIIVERKVNLNDTEIQADTAVAVKFISINGTTIEVSMRSDGRIILEADDLMIEPCSSNMIYIHTKKPEVKS